MPARPGYQTRWKAAVYVLIAMAFMIFGLAVINFSLVRANARQDTELRLTQERLDAAETLRKSQARAASMARAAECQARVAGAKLGNSIISEIRSAFVDLSVAVDNPEVRDSLNAHARALPHFDLPTCPSQPKAVTP